MKKLGWVLCVIAAVTLLLAACVGKGTPAGVTTTGTSTTEVTSTTRVPTTTRSSTSAAAVTTTEATTIPTTATSTTSASAPDPVLSPEAQKLYDKIMANKDVWWNDRLIGGTLIDIDFCGEAELVTDGISIYKFIGEKMVKTEYINTNFTLGSDTGGARSLIPYVFDDGVKGWIMPKLWYNSELKCSQYILGAFEFKDGMIIRQETFFESRIYANGDKTLNGYYGYEYLNTEFFINGEEYTAGKEKTDVFFKELMDILIDAEIQSELSEEFPVDMYFPWYCGRYYPNPSQSEWEKLKEIFIKDLLSKGPAYNILPDVNSYYAYGGMSGSWGDNRYIEDSVKRLVVAYCGGDNKYFETGYFIYSNGGAMCKPVIYLYPTEPADVRVRVWFPQGGRFTCTYPDYGMGWDVTAYPDGTVINKADGLEYSYLYWSGEGRVEWDLSSGFVVRGSDTAAFLREKLAYLGLTPREYNEFIVYWLPLMQGNAYNLITFQTAAYEAAAAMRVTPEPDSLLRVFMAYAPLDKWIDVPEQTLEPFARAGFTVIEWGGTQIGGGIR